MRTKDFCAAIEAGFAKAYPQDGGDSAFITVPYIDRASGEVRECLGILLAKGEHFAVAVAHAAHWVVEDPDLLFTDDGGHDDQLDRLEDFHNLVEGMQTATYMQWTCVYFPGLTEAQVLGDSEAGHEPQLVTDTAVGRNPITGTMEN